VLRGFLTTTLRVDVPAALLRMPENSFCEVLLGAVAQLVELLAAVDATGPVGRWWCSPGWACLAVPLWATPNRVKGARCRSRRFAMAFGPP